MDFSSDILFSFGLNLAGYLVAAMLVFVLIGQRRSSKAKVETDIALVSSEEANKAVTRPKTASPVNVPAPEFISLADQTKRPDDKSVRIHPASSDRGEQVSVAATRRADRRAICREARRLLAKGKSRSELLDRLPLTEDEVEMLSAASNA